jgi:hypothetical protein
MAERRERRERALPVDPICDMPRTLGLVIGNTAAVR